MLLETAVSSSITHDTYSQAHS